MTASNNDWKRLMHKDLEAAFNRVVAILKKDQRCKGGWHYGSISRGTEDMYSDYDPVFLVADQDFEAFAADVPQMLAEASDELIVFWGESFNDAHFKNYCSVIRLGDQLHQFDFSLLTRIILKIGCADSTVRAVQENSLFLTEPEK